MSKRTDLAAGQINSHDTITVELVEPPNSPPFIAITWPLKATATTVGAFPAVASRAASLFAQAATKLAQLRRERGGLR
jgi:hypothetical protein